MDVINAETFRERLAWMDHKFGPGEPVAVFDFDGVLSSPVEDFVYRMPEYAGERERLAGLAERHAITPDLYDTNYLRHLVVQAELHRDRVLPYPGPLLDIARDVSQAKRPFFILTARSGSAAIRRLLAFVDSYELTPQEIFCVGRVAKGRQLGIIRSTVSSGHPLVYFEDTIRHIRNSRQQDIRGFKTVHVAWAEPDWSRIEEFYLSLLADTIDSAEVRNVA